MLYQIVQQQAVKIPEKYYNKLKREKKETSILAYLTVPELKKRQKQLALSDALIRWCGCVDTSFRSTMQVRDGQLYGSITYVNVKKLEKNRCQIAVVITAGQVLIVPVVDAEQESARLFKQALKRYKEMSCTRFIYAFWELLLQGGNEVMEQMEKQIVGMEHEIVENRIEASLNKEIFLLKKQISILKNYYEQLAEMAETLQENELEYFAEEDLRYFQILTGRARRLCDGIMDIRENLVHLREALDASLEYNLNRIMKVFTVVTTVFLPLTLIAGWYGMNFENMPELTWKYGYYGVIGVSLAVVAICFAFFYYKKFL